MGERENAAAAFQGPGFRGRRFLSALHGLPLGVVSPASEGGPLDNRPPFQRIEGPKRRPLGRVYFGPKKAAALGVVMRERAAFRSAFAKHALDRWRGVMRSRPRHKALLGEARGDGAKRAAVIQLAAASTASGRISATLLRPSHLPLPSSVTRSCLARLRSRAPFSFATSRAFSNSANAPAIWRIAFFIGSLVSVRSSPA